MTPERLLKASEWLQKIETHEEGYAWMDNYGGDLLDHIQQQDERIVDLQREIKRYETALFGEGNE